MEWRVALATHLKMTRQCCETSSYKLSKKQITPVSQSLSVDSFSSHACMFFHSFSYKFQMEINVAPATPLKLKR